MSRRTPFSLEKLLRSQWGQAAFVAILVLIVSLAMSVPRFEIAELRGGVYDRKEILLREVVRWGVWGLAAWPISLLARWTLSKSGSWTLLLLMQLPLSMACGWGSLHVDYALRDVGRLPEREWRDRRPGGPRGPEDRSERGDDQRRPEDRFDRGRRRGPGFDDNGPTWDSIFWRQRWMSAILVYWVVLGMGAGLHSFLGMRDKERRATELELRAERLRAELARAQVGSLRNQLNPHFLFNALHSVGGLVRAGEEQLALRTLAAIGVLLRSTLDHGGAEEFSLGEELDVAERYLDIERIRLGERLETEFDVPDDLRGARVPTLLLLPLVENAVRHGIAPLTEGGRVWVRAERVERGLAIEVGDNGVGFSQDVLERSGASTSEGRRSIGLENTHNRLTALYGERASFELANNATGGACVRLVLPLAENRESPDQA